MSLNLQRTQVNELLYVGFNQDSGCFAVGTDQGFRIYNCEPFKETFRRDFAATITGGVGTNNNSSNSSSGNNNSNNGGSGGGGSGGGGGSNTNGATGGVNGISNNNNNNNTAISGGGGVGMVEMLFRCNILALVGGGRTPRYPPHKVMIWDDHQNRCIGELSFRAEVKAVRLRRDRVVVALERRVYIYNFADLTLVDHVETVENPRGLCALSPSPSNNVLACPGVHKGHVRVELYDQRKTTLIAAHETALACIALNVLGTRLATASEKGTLIRVYDTASGELLQELRRGADKAEIHCLAFSQGSTMLACTSDKGTCHMFKLRENVWDTTTTITSSSSSGSSASSSSTPSGNNSLNATTTGNNNNAVVGSGSTSSSSSSSSTAAGAVAGTNGVAGAQSNSASAHAAASSPTNSSSLSKNSTTPNSSSSSSSAANSNTTNNTTTAALSSTTNPSGDSSLADTNSASSLAASAAAAGGGASVAAGGGFSRIKNILPKYFSSEWSFAQFRVPEGKSICAFGTSEPNTLIVVGADGSFFKANFERGGEAVRVAYAQFVRSSAQSLVGMSSSTVGGGMMMMNATAGGSNTLGNALVTG